MKKKLEFSKLIFYGVSILTLFVVLFTCLMVGITQDLSPLSYLIPAVFAELATATAFYYNKAKLENTIKLQKKYNINLDSENM